VEESASSNPVTLMRSSEATERERKISHCMQTLSLDENKSGKMNEDAHLLTRTYSRTSIERKENEWVWS
jgi:hypothetical protein